MRQSKVFLHEAWKNSGLFWARVHLCEQEVLRATLPLLSKVDKPEPPLPPRFRQPYILQQKQIDYMFIPDIRTICVGMCFNSLLYSACLQFHPTSNTL